MNFSMDIVASGLHLMLLVQDSLPPVPEMEPIFEPETVAFSPETPAWYVLGGVLLTILSLGLYRVVKNFSKNAYRREALKSLSHLEKPGAQADPASVINEIRILIKQCAIAGYGRSRVAPLYGEEWLQFLETTGKNTPFTHHKELIEKGNMHQLMESNSDLASLVKIAKKWIRSHA